MKNIISKLPKLAKKQIIIICIVLGVLIIGAVLIILLFKDKELTSQANSRKYDYISPEGYANDSGEYLYLTQDFGDESPKYKIYGEIGSVKYGYVDSKSLPLREEERTTSIHVDCGESIVEPTEENGVININIDYQNEETFEYTTTPLGEEPVEVGNHCTV